MNLFAEQEQKLRTDVWTQWGKKRGDELSGEC